MIGYFVLGTLAAFGLFSALWALLGWLLPGGKGCALVCVGMPDEGILTRSKWLHSLGLLRCPLVVVSEERQPLHPEIEICSREELVPRLERERNHGTGIGDPPGRNQRCGVSEL